jgi:hypothetical protein
MLPAGPTEVQIDGEWVLGERKYDIIQFYADPGGLRTVPANDIVAVAEPGEKFT